MAELAQRVESEKLGITCGFDKRYVSLFGGIAYVDYRGKLHHQGLGDEPFATYERLDRWVDTLPLVAVSSGVSRNTGDVLGKMRPRYLREHEEWVDRRTEMPPMLRFMSAAWETAWRGKVALVAGNWPEFGAFMNANHRLVDEMMTSCGLENGAGSANNHLIRTALDEGALGAKLTGAGGGGSVFALTSPGHEDRIVEAWEQDIAELGLAQCRWSAKMSG